MDIGLPYNSDLVQNTDTLFVPVDYSLLKDVPSWAHVNLDEAAVLDAEDHRLRVQSDSRFLGRRLLLCNLDTAELARHVYSLVVRCVVVAVCRVFRGPRFLAYDLLLFLAAQILEPVCRLCYP